MRVRSINKFFKHFKNEYWSDGEEEEEEQNRGDNAIHVHTNCMYEPSVFYAGKTNYVCVIFSFINIVCVSFA